MRFPVGLARLAWVLAAVLLSTLVACGGKDDEYPTPKALCGVPVETARLDDLLPFGSRVRQVETELASSITSCEVIVDEKVVFSVQQEWWDESLTAARFARSQAYVRPEREAADGAQVYSPTGAVAVVECAATSEDLFLVVKVHQGKGGLESMGEFIEGYASEVAKMNPCVERREHMGR